MEPTKQIVVFYRDQTGKPTKVTLVLNEDETLENELTFLREIGLKIWKQRTEVDGHYIVIPYHMVTEYHVLWVGEDSL